MSAPPISRPCQVCWRPRFVLVPNHNNTVLRPPAVAVKIRKGPLKPCFHVNIKGEIPVYGQDVARLGMFIWSLYSGTLVWNFICGLAGISRGTTSITMVCPPCLCTGFVCDAVTPTARLSVP